ncbi:TonB-dependent receptor plug domain-containing protein [Emticicia sp. CRIBPO]|uniref:TonB-dependent receptor n=1 Tax=Emticicia sp. CRIBPO TaxID=2683258 RepID=UPI001412C14B|nr:TonB-dependent receptor [Emticicia sp. CRIBPO]NBA86215.1 TonB-dependent receptor plug domain-containing protein [Emticicia sp. CRIBPO]
MMFIKKILLTLAYLTFTFCAFSQQTQTIRGRISDAQSHSPVESATVSIAGTGKTVQTDNQGNFTFTEVSLGRLELLVTSVGYAPQTIKELLLESSKELVLEIALTPSLTNLNEISVKAASPNLSGALTSLNTITMEQVQRFPATFLDPARLAFSFAGVANTNDQANGMAIRGNSPNGMQWRLEGVEIVNPNHLSNAGTFGDRATQTGGGTNILSAQLLGSMNFLTGAFPAEYGNALSGIMDMRFRKGNNKKYEHTVQAGLVGVDIASEGPLNRQKGSSYLINYRYSFTGLLGLMGIDFGGESITFQDLSLKLNFPTKRLGEISVFAMGGNSSNIFKSDPDATTWESEKDLQNITFKSKMGVAGISQSKNLNKNWNLKNVLVMSGLDNSRFSTGLKPTAEFDSTIKTRISYSGIINGKLNRSTSLKAGLFLTRQYDQLSYDKMNASFDYSSVVIQPFVSLSKSFNDKLSLNVGLHNLNYTYNNTSTLEPRASVGYQLTSSQNINLAYGLHSQTPAASVLYLAKDIKPIKSQHYVLQYKIDFKDASFLKTELYYQGISNVPDPVNPISSAPQLSYYSTLNDIEVVSFARPFIFVNEGKGRNFGIELTYQKYLSKGFFALINTTLYKAQFLAFDDKYYETRFSGNHIVNLTLGKEWARTKSRILGINGRVVWLGGFRDYNIDLAKSEQNQTTSFDYTRPLTVKNPDYFRPDLRVYFKRSRTKFSRTLSVDLQNVAGYKNVAFSYYDTYQKKVITKYQMGLVPMLNYRIEF